MTKSRQNWVKRSPRHSEKKTRKRGIPHTSLSLHACKHKRYSDDIGYRNHPMLGVALYGGQSMSDRLRSSRAGLLWVSKDIFTSVLVSGQESHLKVLVELRERMSDACHDRGAPLFSLRSFTFGAVRPLLSMSRSGRKKINLLYRERKKIPRPRLCNDNHANKKKEKQYYESRTDKNNVVVCCSHGLGVQRESCIFFFHLFPTILG